MLTHLAVVDIENAEIDGDLDRIISLAECSLVQLSEFGESFNRSMYREIQAIADLSASLRSAVRELSPSEITGAHIPEAGRELMAIVEATETATNTIMERAEAMLAADHRNPPAYRATIEAHVTAIFEACAFQDITGQRIAKICEALDAIDRRVQRFKGMGEAGARSMDKAEAAKASRRERLILNGPAAVGQGVSQDDIDKVFAA